MAWLKAVSSLVSYSPSLNISLITTTLTVAISLMLYWWHKYPAIVLKNMTRFGLYLVGMKQKFVDVKGLKLRYIEKGTKRKGVPSLFMLHGFSTDNNMYLPLVLFAIETGLTEQPFHILGTSLGGAISAVYSAMYPEDVAKATLVCPAMMTPKETDFQREVKKGNCLLLGNSLDDVATIVDKCLYNKTILHKNKQILLAIAQQRAPHKDFYERLFNVITEMIEERQEMFEEMLRSVQAPTQLIWGKHDQVDVLEECGHIVSFDRPWYMAKIVREFMAYRDGLTE
ncbi:hypothetical protein LSH36_278g05007 [Paralvinella palmiformis]|uniref:acylglycerol lipase n=1 Tax=Paralvinella palmiformis TaxID=53620 RepID=A0AAD9N4K1_9ANNE|nr:hypothetical protein LSH36_278g05007 [Paralvinella palmiformis]